MEKDKKVLIEKVNKAKTYKELLKVLESYKLQVEMIISLN